MRSRRRRLLGPALGVVSLLSGCQAVNGQTPKPQTKPAIAPASAPKVTPMSDGFEVASAAFVAHAAQHYGVQPAQIFIVPKTAGLAETWKVASGATQINPKVGAAWAFETARGGQPGPPLRGWALADGTIITRKANLGQLMIAAGLAPGQAAPAQAAPSHTTPGQATPIQSPGPLTPEQLVQRLIWSFGPPHVPSDQPVTQTHASPGTPGTLTFSSRLIIPGGPLQVASFILTQTADGQAELKTAP